MSPSIKSWVRCLVRFPRVSGDEPVYNRVVARGQEFSPREWG